MLLLIAIMRFIGLRRGAGDVSLHLLIIIHGYRYAVELWVCCSEVSRVEIKKEEGVD